MESFSKIRTVVCSAQGAARDGIENAVAEGGEFVVVGQAANAAEARSIVRGAQPDLLVVDDSLPDLPAADLLLELATERVIPALLFSDRQTAANDRLRRAGVSTMPRRLLFGDADALTHVRTRLQVLSARCSSRRRTQSMEVLEGALARVRRSEIDRQFSPEVAAIVANPLELVVLVGGRGSTRCLLNVFASLERLPVPVVVALQDADYYRLREVDRVRIHELDHGVTLRALNGIVLAGPNQHLEVSGDFLHVSRASLDTTGFLDSLAALGSRCLIVVISGDDDDEVIGLAHVARMGCALAVLGPDEVVAPQANRAALAGHRIDAVLDLRALTWLLQHTVPRRT